MRRLWGMRERGFQDYSWVFALSTLMHGVATGPNKEPRERKRFGNGQFYFRHVKF